MGIRDERLERDVSAYIRTKTGPVRFEFDYIPLRVCHLMAAHATVHGVPVLYFRYISNMTVEDVKGCIDAVEADLLAPGKFRVVRMDKRHTGQLLDECQLYTITGDGFEAVTDE